MPRDGAATRAALLAAARALTLERGFAGTSVDEILAAAGFSKGAFFHHFASKADLGRALVEDQIRTDAEDLERNMRRAELRAGDSVERLLMFVELLIEEAERPAAEVGSLIGSVLAQRGTLDDATRSAITAWMDERRGRVATLIARAAMARRPRIPIDPVALAEALTSTHEGAVVLARALDDPATVGRQLRQYREHLRLLFED